MSNSVGNVQQGRVGRSDRIRKSIIPALTLLLIIAITIVLFLYGPNQEKLAELGEYRYLGAFLVSLIGNATVLLPGIVLPILTALGVDFYRMTGELMGTVMIGLAGGGGAAIGEIVGYTAGYSGRRIVQDEKRYEKVENWVKRWGTLGIFIFTLVPLFFDLVGLAAGALRFPLWKFVLVCWLGRTILYVAIVVLAVFGWKVVLPYFG